MWATVKTAVPSLGHASLLSIFPREIQMKSELTKGLRVLGLLNVSGFTKSFPEPCKPRGRRMVPKNVNNASELSAGLNEPFRGRMQLKVKI